MDRRDQGALGSAPTVQLTQLATALCEANWNPMGPLDYTINGNQVVLPDANKMQIQVKSVGNFSYTSRVRTPLITNV